MVCLFECAFHAGGAHRVGLGEVGVDALGGRAEAQAGLQHPAVSAFPLLDPHGGLMALPFFIFARALYQEHMVGVLLKVATVAQVTDHRPLVSPVLARAVELGETYDGDAELFLECRQAVADGLEWRECLGLARLE